MDSNPYVTMNHRVTTAVSAGQEHIPELQKLSPGNGAHFCDYRLYGRSTLSPEHKKTFIKRHLWPRLAPEISPLHHEVPSRQRITPASDCRAGRYQSKNKAERRTTCICFCSCARHEKAGQARGSEARCGWPISALIHPSLFASFLPFSPYVSVFLWQGTVASCTVSMILDQSSKPIVYATLSFFHYISWLPRDSSSL